MSATLKPFFFKQNKNKIAFSGENHLDYTQKQNKTQHNFALFFRKQQQAVDPLLGP